MTRIKLHSELMAVAYGRMSALNRADLPAPTSLDTRKYWAQNEAYFMRILPDPQLAQIDVSLTNMRNALRTRSVPLKVYGARLLEHYPSSTLPMRIGDCTTTQLSAQGLTPVPPLACSCTAERAESDLRVAAVSPLCRRWFTPHPPCAGGMCGQWARPAGASGGCGTWHGRRGASGGCGSRAAPGTPGQPGGSLRSLVLGSLRSAREFWPPARDL